MGKLFLFDTIAEHLWWLEATVDAKTVDGDVLRVDASDIVGKHLYYFGVWEPGLTGWLKRSLKPGHLFIDVGANIGYYSLLAARLVGSGGKVVAIEALPQTFQRLQENVERNRAQNVRAVNSAAWDKLARLKLFVRQEGPSGATTLLSAWADQWNLRRQVEIDAAPLALTLEATEIERARIIKIDVEGAEWQVITEMTSWLARTAPDLEIALEVSSSMVNHQGKSFDDVLSLFSGFGFQAYRVENDYLASSCVHWRKYRAPYRLTKWPTEAVDQIDVIFSRVNAASL
jgi:FkbM family methyltransferase